MSTTEKTGRKLSQEEASSFTFPRWITETQVLFSSAVVAAGSWRKMEVDSIQSYLIQEASVPVDGLTCSIAVPAPAIPMN